MTPTMAARAAMTGFVVSVSIHLASLTAEITGLEWVTKALLMPTLAAWVLARRGPRLIVVALVFSAAGDIALQIDALFLAGMGFFAGAHACYVMFFLRSGVGASLRRRWFIPLGYAVVWAGLVTLLWPALGALRIPVAAYALILTGTAITAAGFGARTGIGGALFFISDALIALRLADLPQPPMPGLWVMSTYIAAQYLLATGSLRHNIDTPVSAASASTTLAPG